MELARFLEGQAMRRREGMVDPREGRYAVEGKHPIGEHIADFAADLKAKGRSGKHYTLTENRVRRVVTLADIQTLAGFQPSKVTGALGILRTGLIVEGKPAVKPVSKASALHYTRAVKMFSAWLEHDNRARGNALKSIKVGTVQKSEHCRVPRAMTAGEFLELVRHVEQAGDVWGMSGGDRAVLYRLAAATGLRASELASLTRESFDLAADGGPVVTVAAAYSKRKRDDVQPLPVELAGVLAHG